MASTSGPSPHQQADQRAYDCGPWVETPFSSRVSRFRYDYANDCIHVQWTNNKNPGYMYFGADRFIYQRMARAASKGKFINSPLNGLWYQPITPDALEAPSNPNRSGLKSRVKGTNNPDFQAEYE